MKSARVMTIFCHLLIIISAALGLSCKQRIGSQLKEDTSAPEEGRQLDTKNQRIAQVIGLALYEYIQSGKAPSTTEFILPRVKALGVSTDEFNAFEDIVLTFYGDLDPKFSNNASFEAGFDLSWEEAGWVRLYYNFEDLSLSTGEGISYVQAAIAFKRYQDNRAEIDGLRSDLLRMSVQEMADARRISVDALRDKLWLYNLSVLSMWQRVMDGERSLYDAAIAMHNEGMSDADIATKLHVGLGALQNLFHHIRLDHHAVAWTASEELRLKALWGKINIKDLAALLGRSEEGISAKARTIPGLTESGVSPRRLSLPEFDGIGRYDVESRYQMIESMLIATMDMDPTELAAVFDVEPATIQRWRTKFDLRVGGGATLGRTDIERKAAREKARDGAKKDRFEKQAFYIEKEIELWQRDKVHVGYSNCKDLLHIGWQTYTQLNIFSDNNARLLALADWVRANPKEWRLFWEKLSRAPQGSDPSKTFRFGIVRRFHDELRPTVQQYYLEKMTEEIALTGGLEGGFSGFAKRHQVGPNAFFGLGGDFAEGASFHTRIFDSTEQCAAALMQQIKSQLAVESDPSRRVKLEQFAPLPALRQVSPSSGTYQALAAQERQKLLTWGERFAAAKGAIPVAAELNRKSASAARGPRRLWSTASDYQTELMTRMREIGFEFEKRGRGGGGTFFVTKIPDGYSLPLKCDLLLDTVTLMENGSEATP